MALTSLVREECLRIRIPPLQMFFPMVPTTLASNRAQKIRPPVNLAPRTLFSNLLYVFSAGCNFLLILWNWTSLALANEEMAISAYAGGPLTISLIAFVCTEIDPYYHHRNLVASVCDGYVVGLKSACVVITQNCVYQNASCYFYCYYYCHLLALCLWFRNSRKWLVLQACLLPCKYACITCIAMQTCTKRKLSFTRPAIFWDCFCYIFHYCNTILNTEKILIRPQLLSRSPALWSILLLLLLYNLYEK